MLENRKLFQTGNSIWQLQQQIVQQIVQIMQQLQMLARPTIRPVSIKIQSKQDFFNIRKGQKRMKVSQCFSQPLDKKMADEQMQDFLLLSQTKDECCQNQLQSTFGSESVLAFKVKLPKRKKNVPLYTMSAIKNDCESESDSETSNIPRLSQTGKMLSKLNLNVKAKQIRSIGINDFSILKKLGQGTYSQVFQAVHKETGFICAIKVLEKWKMLQLKVVENVLRQIKINYFLEHPNIAQIYAFFDDRNYIYLVCQYATDRTLYELLNQQKFKLTKGLFSDQASKILSQLCQAVKHLHNHSVIHRDIKPQNILVTLHGTVKLCDFGWAVYSPSRQMRSTLCGTPLYLAPQLVKQAEYDESVDVWALGILAFQMLTKENPFKISQLKDLSKIIYDEVKFEGIRNKAAIDFIKRALQKDSSLRSSIYELVNHPFLTSKIQSEVNF